MKVCIDGLCPQQTSLPERSLASISTICASQSFLHSWQNSKNNETALIMTRHHTSEPSRAVISAAIVGSLRGWTWSYVKRECDSCSMPQTIENRFVSAVMKIFTTCRWLWIYRDSFRFALISFMLCPEALSISRQHSFRSIFLHETFLCTKQSKIRMTWTS